MTKIFFSTANLWLAATLSLSCSSLTREKCEKISWRDLGFESGKKGLALQDSAWKMTASTCSKLGDNPDRITFENGFRRGRYEYYQHKVTEQTTELEKISNKIQETRQANEKEVSRLQEEQTEITNELEKSRSEIAKMQPFVSTP